MTKRGSAERKKNWYLAHIWALFFPHVSTYSSGGCLQSCRYRYRYTFQYWCRWVLLLLLIVLCLVNIIAGSAFVFEYGWRASAVALDTAKYLISSVSNCQALQLYQHLDLQQHMSKDWQPPVLLLFFHHKWWVLKLQECRDAISLPNR